MAARVIPSNDDDFRDWLNNLNVKLPGYAVLLNIAAARIAQLAADYVYFDWLLDCQEPVSAAKTQFTAAKNLVRDGIPSGGGTPPTATVPTLPTLAINPPPVPAGIVQRCSDLIVDIRKSSNYTDAIGADLKILTTPPTVLSHPTGKATALPNSQVELTWIKGTHQAVIVESQVGNETDWTVLGPKMNKPWIDDRPPAVAGQPEVRRYRLRFQDHDEPVGDYSDVLTVTTRP